jgi:hypothetical protein
MQAVVKARLHVRLDAPDPKGTPMLFDPASIVMSARSGLNPPDWLVLMPDRAHLRQERFELGLGRVAGVVYAVIWLIVVPTSGVIPHLISNPLSVNPLVVAAVYLFGFTTALGCLFAGFWVIPRSLARRSQQALILTPGGLVLADWTTGEALKAVDYHATDDLKLKWVPPDEAGPLIDYLLIRRHGKTTRWNVEDYFTKRSGEIAERVMQDYARAKESVGLANR